MKLIFTITIINLFISCSPSNEVILPFKNLAYSGERILPIKDNNSEKTIRIWFNNSTSIDRVITISKDSIVGFQGKLIEIGYTSTKKNNRSKFYNELDIKPKSGFENFFKKLETLGVNQIKTQSNNFQIALHQPFSLYIIESKNYETYNQFRFYSNFPNENEKEDIYTSIEKLIFNEFPLFFHFEKK